jgi:hypothetical protein
MERLTIQNFIKQWWFRQQGESDEVVRLRVEGRRMEDGYEVDAQTKRDIFSLQEQDALYESFVQRLTSYPAKISTFIFNAIWILFVIGVLIYGLFSIDSINPVALAIIIGAIIIAVAIKSKE